MKTTALRMVLGAALCLTGVQVAAAQDYPTRPITYILPFAGGSASAFSNPSSPRLAAALVRTSATERRP